MMELMALQESLQLAASNNLAPIEVETDATEVLTLLEKPQPFLHSIILTCRQLLRQLGNLVVRHNFRQGNKVADFLATQGSSLHLFNKLYVMPTPLPAVMQKMDADKKGVIARKWVTTTTSNSLTMLCNISIISTNVTNHVPSRDPVAISHFVTDANIIYIYTHKPYKPKK